MLWCYFRWLKKQGGAHIVNRSWMDALKSVTKLCVKSVSIRRFSGLYFPTFGLNTERYSHVSLHIQSKCWKVLTRKTPNKDKNTFHVVESIQVSIIWIRLIFWIIRNSTKKIPSLIQYQSLREKCQTRKCSYLWSVFCSIRIKYRDLRSIRSKSPY